LEHRQAYEFDRRLELTDEIYRLRWAIHAERAEQAHFPDRWSILSPIANYQVLSYRLARTTMDDKFYLAQAIQRYRETFIQYLRGKLAASRRRWFTDDPPHQAPMIPDPEAFTAEMLSLDSPFLQERMAWARAENERVEKEGSRRLDLSDLPKYPGAGYRSLGESLAIMLPGLAVMALLLVLAILVSVVRFNTYDPR
jgi:hypothetical protein